MAKINSLKSIFTLFFSFWVLALFAQGDVSAGITEATSMVTSYFDPATKLIYAIGAIVGLIGGVKVYSKFSSGDPDTGKTAASWFGACIFLIVAATILRSFFL
ncbi:MAG: conjugal transfer protein [Bacteroidetes bacterium GWB2_41_8]|nr:MAG: conjugal transfer protein [Bacteroidetes bacterium GWB2_41_8]